MWAIFFRNGAQFTGCTRVESYFRLKEAVSESECDGKWLEWSWEESINGTLLYLSTSKEALKPDGGNNLLTLKYALYISAERRKWRLYLWQRQHIVFLIAKEILNICICSKDWENLTWFWGAELLILLVIILRVYFAGRLWTHISGIKIFGGVLSPSETTLDPDVRRLWRKKCCFLCIAYYVLVETWTLVGFAYVRQPEERFVRKHFVDYQADKWVCLGVSVLLTKVYVDHVLKRNTDVWHSEKSKSSLAHVV